MCFFLLVPFEDFILLFGFQEFDCDVLTYGISCVYLARVSRASWKIVAIVSLIIFPPISLSSLSRIPITYLLDNLIFFHRSLRL